MDADGPWSVSYRRRKDIAQVQLDDEDLRARGRPRHVGIRPLFDSAWMSVLDGRSDGMLNEREDDELTAVNAASVFI